MRHIVKAMNHNTTFACSVSTKDDEVLKACTTLFSSVCDIIKDKLKDIKSPLSVSFTVTRAEEIKNEEKRCCCKQ